MCENQNGPLLIPGDVDGDLADLVGVSSTGGVVAYRTMVNDSGAISFPAEPWSDQVLNFCPRSPESKKQVCDFSNSAQDRNPFCISYIEN